MKYPREVQAIPGQLNVNALTGTIQNFSQVGIGGDVTGGSAKLYVNGNVGIGTTNPGAKLDVSGTGNLSGGTVTAPTFSGNLSGGTVTGSTFSIGSITGDGMIENTRGGYTHIGAWGVARTAANAVLVNTAYMADTVPWTGVTSIPSHIANMNQWVNSNSSPSFNSITVPTYCGANCGIIYFGDTNVNINRQANNMFIGTTWNYIGLYNTYSYVTFLPWAGSDQRFKKNITPITNSTDILNAIDGVFFDWDYDNAAAKDFGKPLSHKQNDVGVIAQTVEKVFPTAVTTDEKGYKLVSYNNFIPLLIEAAKTHDKQITSLQNITTDFISKFKEGLIETKKLIVDGVDILKKLNELSLKVENQQRQIEELKKAVEELRK